MRERLSPAPAVALLVVLAVVAVAATAGAASTPGPVSVNATVAPPPGDVQSSGEPIVPACPGAVVLVSITAQPGPRPRVRLVGRAPVDWAGRAVTARRNGAPVATGFVGADGMVRLSAPAPRGARARAVARYQVVVGTARSLALKATRVLRVTSIVRHPDGTVTVTGRVPTTRARTLVIRGRQWCSRGESGPGTRVRTTRRGAFRVLLSPPPADGRVSALAYRIVDGLHTASWPIVLPRRAAA